MSDISIPEANDFSNVDVDSIQCINKMCDVVMSMHLDNVYITSKASMYSPFAVGFGPGKIFRFDRGSILFSTATLPSADFMDLQMGGGSNDLLSSLQPQNDGTALEEEAYLYKTPGVALSWFLCKLGYGTNEANLEADRITFRPQSPFGVNKDILVTLCFEEEVSPEQKMVYKAFASSIEQMPPPPSSSEKIEKAFGGGGGGDQPAFLEHEPENPSEKELDARKKLDELLGVNENPSKQSAGFGEQLFGGGGAPDRSEIQDRSAFFGRSLLDKIKANH